MGFYPLIVALLAWASATAMVLVPGRTTRPVALFVAMHVIAVAAITVLVATQTIHWGALALPLATLRSVLGVANDWAHDDTETGARVRATALKVPAVALVWVVGWAFAGAA